MDVLESRNVTFEEFTQKTGTEVLRRSMQRFQRTTFNEDLVIKTKLRTSWISQMQICFQPWFDTDNFYAIDDQVSINSRLRCVSKLKENHLLSIRFSTSNNTKALGITSYPLVGTFVIFAGKLENCCVRCIRSHVFR